MGQLLRQGGRFFAIYISDLLLWLSLAGIFEILLVIVAGALCILTAGFIFEGMKKHPVVLVLGTAVALTGSFLVFREVRGFIWPAPIAAEADVTPARTFPPTTTGTPGRTWPPTTSVTPSPFDLPKTSPFDLPKTTLKPAKPRGSDCASRMRGTCDASHGCYWSLISSRCKALSGASAPDTRPKPTPLGTVSFCALNTNKITCSAIDHCYWSSLTNRCETLKVGRELFSGSSTAPERCLGKTELMCLSTASCKWSSSLKLCSSAGQAPSGRR